MRYQTKRSIKKQYRTLQLAYDHDQEEHARLWDIRSQAMTNMMNRDRDLCEQLRELRAERDRLQNQLNAIHRSVMGVFNRE